MTEPVSSRKKTPKRTSKSYGRRDKVTANARAEFIEKLRDTANVSAAARDSGHVRQTWYGFREKDPAFASAWDDAIEEATDDLEQEARRRAKDGVDKPVYQQGKKVGVIREYSDHLMTTLLRAHRPEKYRDNQTVTVTGIARSPEFIPSEEDEAAFRHAATDKGLIH